MIELRRRQQILSVVARTLFSMLLLLVCFLIWLTPAGAQQRSAAREKLDVLLLIDDSDSMNRTDPFGIRYRLASAFVGFLKLNTDTIDSRVGAIRFGWPWFGLGSSSKEVIRGLESSDNDQRIRREIETASRERPMGGTDFVGAFLAAYEHFDGAGAFSCAGCTRAVVLLTDGWQHTWLPMDIKWVRELVFQWIREQAEELKNVGCQLFVIYTGEAARYEEEWETIATQGRSYWISDMEYAPDAYREILVHLTGRDFGDRVLAECVTGSQTASLIVEPYLEKAVFTILKDARGVDFVLRNPGGDVVERSALDIIHTVGTFDEGYSIPNPESGRWTIELRGTGCVSVWVDRYMYEIQVDRPSPEGVLRVGDPMSVKAYLYDRTEEAKSPVPSDPKFPLTFHANVRTGAGELFERVPMTGDFSTKSVSTGTSNAALEEGSYSIEVVAGAVGIAHSLKTKVVEGISAIVVPRLVEVLVSPPLVPSGATAELVARFTGLETVTVGTEFNVMAYLVDPDGSQSAERIKLTRIPEKSEFTALIGHIDEAGTVTEFTDEDPKGTYQVVVETAFVAPGQVFGEKAESSFCLRHKKEDLPTLGEAFLANRQGRRVNRVPFAEAEECWLEVRVENLSVANPDSLAVSAEVRDQERRLVDSVLLIPNPDRSGDVSGRLPALGAFTGCWGRRSYSVDLQLAKGETTYGCEFPGDSSTMSFKAFKPIPWWIMVVACVAAGLVFFGIVWKCFHPKPPPVGGKLMITNPNGDELPEVDLYGRGSRISIGSEGSVMLDATLDPEASGSPAEIRAAFRGRHNVVRSMWRKVGKRFEKSEDIYNGDVFWVGRYRIRYVNTAAERETQM